jgi:hypothetical protein
VHPRPDRSKQNGTASERFLTFVSGFAASKSAADAPCWNQRPCSAFRYGRQLAEMPDAMTLSTLLLIILILALVGALPSWPYSRGWGYGPSGLLGVVLVVLLVMALLGRGPA